MTDRKSKPPPKSRKSRKKARAAADEAAKTPPDPGGTPDSDPAITRDSDPAVTRDSDPAVTRDSDPAVTRDSDPAVAAPIPLEGTQPIETAAIVATTTETESKVITIEAVPDSAAIARSNPVESDAVKSAADAQKLADAVVGDNKLAAPAAESKAPAAIEPVTTSVEPATEATKPRSTEATKSSSTEATKPSPSETTNATTADLTTPSSLEAVTSGPSALDAKPVESGVTEASSPANVATEPSKPALSVVPALLDLPSLSTSGGTLDLRESPRRSGDDRRREDRPEPPPPPKPTPSTTERSDAAAGEIIERRRGDDRREAPIATAVGEAVAYMFDPEAATMPAPELMATQQQQVQTLDPGTAALEAARIAGEIVGDISTASGAAIVAAAAAGAAIEAARQQQAAGVSTVLPQAAGAAAAAAVAAATTAANAGAPPASDGSTGDPVTTVRMHRERILRALAEDIAQNPALGEVKDPLTSSSASAPLARAGSQSAEAGITADAETDDAPLDPVQIAAAAIQRLRQRASTDIAQLRGHYHRHDLVVLLAALIIIVVAGRVHTGMTTPPNVMFPEHEKDEEAIARGLTFEHSQAWLKAEKLPPWPPRIAHDPTGQPPKATGAYYSALTSSVDPNAKIEIYIDKRPAWTNIVTGLELDRRQRWGELYTLDESTVEEIEDQNWLRTAYRYAHAPEKGDVPRVDRAIEYATVDREQIYIVTLFGSEQELSRIESVVAPTLRVPQKPGSRSALPLVPQTRGATHRSYPDPVAKAFDSTVMIVVADMVDGRLQARGGGSGVIVGADGSILTNYHVIHDKNGRLHDVFVIGRFSQLDKAPQLQCAGRPNRSKLQRELDLALVKCDTDLDGRTWTPSTVGIWATLAPAKTTDLIGQRIWVLGFPDVGGGGLTLSTGEIGGWTGQDGTSGRDFIKTDASITHGNSGGPAVDDKGRLIGIATASRTRLSQGGGVIETKQVGLVRPLPAAADLMSIATIGWTPREGRTDVEIQPSAVEASPEGIRIATHVVDHANDAPVRDALVMVLKGGVKEGSIDINRLDDQVIAWGRSNTQGEVALKQPVPPGTYTVLVRASGYQPLIGDNALVLDDKSPTAFDPWGGIRLRPL